MKLSGNTILITGGSSGIGFALAKSFAALYNTVIITGRDAQKLEAAKLEIPALHIFRCDLANKYAIDELLVYLEQNFPTLNILINNAGIQYNYSFIHSGNISEKIDYEIATNFSAPVKLSSLLLPLLLNQPTSAIINVSSGLMISPKKSASVYCATKAAIHSYSKTLRYQLSDTNVKVFEIVPPLVATAMTEGRGRTKKITAEQLAKEFLKGFKANRFEIYIGKSKLLKWVNRISPALADSIMKNGV